MNFDEQCQKVRDDMVTEEPYDWDKWWEELGGEIPMHKGEIGYDE